jgi:hypothetical protein
LCRAGAQQGLSNAGKRGEGGQEQGEEEDDEELQPYDLTDDEEDLEPVGKPRYLSRIIECTYA